jgi:hemerythrin superfamily protein
MKRSNGKQRRGQKENGGGILEEATQALQRGWAALRGTVGGLAASDTDALVMLRAHHRNVDRLFARIERALDGDPARARPLVNELAEALTMHAQIEETIFYPAVTADETRSLVDESFEEHRLMKRALADLVRATGLGSRDLEAKVKALKELVVHHAKEEEEAKLFPKVRRLLDGDQREAVGQEMLAAMVDMQAAAAPAGALRPRPA